jgi:hypothetical protein
MSNTSKMDTSAVFEMFETIKELVIKQPQKQPQKQTESVKVDIDTSALDAATARIEIAVEEVKKPMIVENHYRHTIDIGSSKVFISLVIMALIIIGLSYAVGEQRRSISQYKKNDLKYRYIKMQGQANEENLYRLERQFQYGDSIKIIRKQVEKYEELVKQQVEKMERAKRSSEEAIKLQKEVESLKLRNKDK